MRDASKVIQYMADISDVKAKIAQLHQMNAQINATMSKGLAANYKQVGASLETIKTTEVNDGVQKLNSSMHQSTSTMQTVNGSLMQVTKTQKINADGAKTTSMAYKDLNTNSVSVAENMKRLAYRAALTIPLWLVLRGAVMGVISTFRDGIKNIAEFDNALRKARRNLQGSAEDITRNFQQLREEVTRMSLESGKSVEEITHAFQKFATVGLDFETSLTGANEATKLATTLFGDTVTNANSLARAFRLLSDNVDDGRAKTEQLKEITALLAHLWKDQAFEINEIAGALERFSPVAAVANMSMEETVKVLTALQTAGL
jgi:methyl-accepting chemotaxis protein